jgi:ATP-dependent Lhr-like helicase
MPAFESLHEALRGAIQNGLGWRSLRPVQELAFEAVTTGANCVILAPTAGGKTEAALFPMVDAILKNRWAGPSVLYICPLRALLNNLEPRVRNICGLVGLSAFKWHGDVEASQKKRFLTEPADILMTTPESLEAMLLSQRIDAKQVFGRLRFFMVDEVHAFAGDDRGAHLLSVLERLQQFAVEDVQRVALSATVGNPDLLLKWLAGSSQRPGQVVRPPHEPKARMLRVVSVPPNGAFVSVAAAEARGEKTLLFVESRRQAESAASGLRDAIPTVFVHHSSVSREARAQAEEAFATAPEAVIVSTATLELGIDVGDLDLVQQYETPKTVSSFLQRLGRTGRRDAPARMTFYEDDDESFIQSIALVNLARRGWVEPVEPTNRAFHVLVHQILTGVLQRPGVLATDLWAVLKTAWPFAGINEEEFLEVVRHMVLASVLDARGGELSLGPEGERRFSAKNYFDLFAVFSGAREVVVKTESGDDIGTLQTRFVVAEQAADFVFVLAGRRWQAVEVNLEAGILYAKPAPQGKLPRWLGSDSAFLSPVIVNEHRRILAGEDTVDFLVGNAPQTLSRLRQTWAPLASVDGWPVAQSQNGLSIFTFCGGRINLTLGRILAARLSCDSAASNYEVTLRSPHLPAFTDLADEIARLGREGFPDDLRESARRALSMRPLSKFQPYLPPRFEAEFLAGRVLDFEGLGEALPGRKLVLVA